MNSDREPAKGMQRLGKNIKGYYGEKIDLRGVQRNCLEAAQANGWTLDEIYPAPRQIIGLSRRASRISERCPRVYLSTGIHGDEPAGPRAVCALLQQNLWPENLDLWLCPWLNPTGFELGQRENKEGRDLNRQYRTPEAAETLAHMAWLRRQPRFDLCICVHEDWESHGFYVYELNPDQQPSLAEAMVEAVAQVCPIDRSEMIEGRVARNGIIRPTWDPLSRPDWPEAFFLLSEKTRLSYTLEAPSDFPLATRVASLVTAVNTALTLISNP